MRLDFTQVYGTFEVVKYKSVSHARLSLCPQGLLLWLKVHCRGGHEYFALLRLLAKCNPQKCGSLS